MATLSSVTGFYYQVGSIDYPSNYSPDHEFGFDTAGATNAVFKYSVNDCEKALASCRSLIKRSTFNSANTNVGGYHHPSCVQPVPPTHWPQNRVSHTSGKASSIA